MSTEEVMCKLKSDVTNYLNNESEITPISNVSDIITRMNIAPISFELNDEIDLDELYEDLNRCRRTAQLVWNLHVDREFYWNNRISESFQSDNDSGNLISIFYKDGSPTQEPQISHVIDAVSEFVCCYFKIKFCEMRKTVEEINKILEKRKIECEICDTELKYGEVLCSICRHPINDTIKKLLISENKKKVTENVNDKERGEVESPGSDQWECKFCQSMNPQNQSNCENCLKSVNGDKILINQRSDCCNCGSDKKIVDEGMCGDCFSARYNDWMCPYKFCGGAVNIGSDKYCKSCGIERSSVLIIGAPIWRCKGHIRDQILICGKCELINEIDKKVCDSCGVTMDKSSKTITNQTKHNKSNEINNNTGMENNQSTGGQRNQWNCEKCGSKIPKNQSLCDRCAHLVDEKEILIDKCVNCGSYKEIVDEGMCGDCFSARYNDWICPYKLCEGTNIVSDKYCKSCGIERSSVLINGAPIWRCKGHIRDQIWICGKCELITEIDKKICHNCGVMMDKSSETITNQMEHNKSNEINNINRMENNQSTGGQRNQWKCEKCGSKIPKNQSLCDGCVHLVDEKEILIDKCVNCGSNKKIVDEGMCGDCFSARYSDWICPYKSCGGATNIGSDKYCKSCGIERSPVLIIDTPIWQWKNGIRDQIWICGKCDCLNEMDRACGRCGVAMEKRSESREKNQSKHSKECATHSNKMNNQSNIIPHDKWRCEICRLINDVFYPWCQGCRQKRVSLPWNCSRCTKRNETSMERCDTCGEIKEMKYCDKCGWRESIMDGLCGPCVTIRDSDGTCFNRLCKYRNNVDDDYCRQCGLYRYCHLEHGAPIMRIIGGECDHVWICFDCGGMNKWKNTSCQSVIKSSSIMGVTYYSAHCYSRRDKYFKWCKACGYKYQISEYTCVKCKQRLYSY